MRLRARCSPEQGDGVLIGSLDKLKQELLGASNAVTCNKAGGVVDAAVWLRDIGRCLSRSKL